MARHECTHLGEWLNTIADLRDAGKTLELADNPATRYLGFSEGGDTYELRIILASDRGKWWESDEERDAVLARLGITERELSDKYLKSETLRKALLLLGGEAG